MTNRDLRGELRTGVERMVSNLAIERRVSRNVAIFLVEQELRSLKRRPPTPPTSPAGSGDGTGTGDVGPAAGDSGSFEIERTQAAASGGQR